MDKKQINMETVYCSLSAFALSSIDSSTSSSKHKITHTFTRTHTIAYLLVICSSMDLLVDDGYHTFFFSVDQNSKQVSKRWHVINFHRSPLFRTQSNHNLK